MVEEKEKDPILSASLISASIIAGPNGSDSVFSIDTPVANADTVNVRQFENAPNILPRSTECAIQMVPNVMDHNLKINHGVWEQPSKFFIESNGRKEAHPKPPLTSNSVTCSQQDKCYISKMGHDQVRGPVISTCNFDGPVRDNCKCGLNRCQLSRPDNCICNLSCCQQSILKCCDCEALKYSERSQLFRRMALIEKFDNVSRSTETQSQKQQGISEKQGISECNSSSPKVSFQKILDLFDRQEETLKQHSKMLQTIVEKMKKQEGMMLKLMEHMALLQGSVSCGHSSNSVAVSPDFNIETVNQTKKIRNENTKNRFEDKRKSNVSEADDAKDASKKNVSLEKRLCKSPCEIVVKKPCCQCSKNHKHRKDSPKNENRKSTGRNEQVEDLEKSSQRITCEDIIRNVEELISAEKDAQQAAIAKRRHSGAKDSGARSKDPNRNAKKRDSVRERLTEYRSGSSSSYADLDSEELDKDKLFKEIIPNLVPEFNLSNNVMSIYTMDYLKKLQKK